MTRDNFNMNSENEAQFNVPYIVSYCPQALLLTDE